MITISNFVDAGNTVHCQWPALAPWYVYEIEYNGTVRGNTLMQNLGHNFDAQWKSSPYFPVGGHYKFTVYAFNVMPAYVGSKTKTCDTSGAIDSSFVQFTF
jgi:hypothetical protein